MKPQTMFAFHLKFYESIFDNHKKRSVHLLGYWHNITHTLAAAVIGNFYQ